LSSKERLASFLRALDDAGIIDFDKNRFNHRLKVQKYVFIAQKFGFRTDYNYSLYIHGPYSSSLADDYYHMGDFRDREPTPLSHGFVRLVKNKSEEWLELAATILMIEKRYGNIDRDTLISLVKTVKPFAEREHLMTIIRNLERSSCLG
jgi:uncharacterized protein YwgA